MVQCIYDVHSTMEYVHQRQSSLYHVNITHYIKFGRFNHILLYQNQIPNFQPFSLPF